MSYRDAGIAARGGAKATYFCCLVFGKGDGERRRWFSMICALWRTQRLDG